MTILTNSKHELFAQEIAKGKSATEAYQAAGYKTDGDAARACASRLLTKANVQARVAELQSRIAEGVVLTQQWVIERLIENANRAMQAVQAKDSTGQPTGEFRYEGNVANRALELLGKELGMFVERVKGDMTVSDAAVDRPPRETHDEWLHRRRRELAAEMGMGTANRSTNGSHNGGLVS